MESTHCEICGAEITQNDIDNGRYFETDTGDLCAECAQELEYQPELDD